MPMTARERLFAALNGESTDHVPIWLLFPYHTTGYYVDVRTHPSYVPIFEASKQYAIMLNRRNLGAPIHTEEVSSRREEFTDGEWQVTRNHVEYRGEGIYSETRTDGVQKRITKLLDTDEDLEFYCSLPIEIDTGRIHTALERQMPKYLQEREEFPKHYGAMMLGLGEPLGPIYGSSNLESYAIWSLTYDETMCDLLDRLMERNRIIYDFCLERELADLYFLVGSEFASPPLVSRSTFQRWSARYAQTLVKSIHGYGKKAIQHYHGQIKEILPDFPGIGADALHTIEDPPIGDCTHTEAFSIVGDSMALIGNIQYDEFRSLSTEQMGDRVREVLAECKGQRLILSPTAGPYDSNIPDSMIQNYLAFMEAAWEYGPWELGVGD